MGKGSVADQLRELDRRADRFFSGHVVEETEPQLAEYAALFYERYRADWSDRQTYEARAFQAFLNPRDSRPQSRDPFEPRPTDVRAGAWAGIRDSVDAWAKRFGSDALVKDPATWRADDNMLPGGLEFNMAYAAYWTGIGSEHPSCMPFKWTTEYGFQALIEAEQWWNTPSITFRQMGDFARHRYFTAAREDDRVMHRKAVRESAKFWAYRTVFDQVRDLGEAPPWAELSGRLELEDVPSPPPPILFSDLREGELQSGAPHTRFKGWILKTYDYYLAWYGTRSPTPMTKAYAETAARHAALHGYLIRRFTSRDGAASPETVRKYVAARANKRI